MKIRKVINLLLEKMILGVDKVVPLDQIDPELAKAVIGGGYLDGDKEDDKIETKKVSVFVKSLKPAQQEIRINQAIGMCLQNLLTGKPDLDDLGSIVSSDNYIMDGHHRWAASFLQNPNNKILVTKIDIPGPALLTALNVITIGKLGVTKGNKGDNSNIADIDAGNVKSVIMKLLKSGDDYMTPQQISEALREVDGSDGDINKAIQILQRNAELLPKDIMPSAPPREQMPVISPKYVPIIKRMFQLGAFDIKKPYSPKVSNKIDRIN